MKQIVAIVFIITLWLPLVAGQMPQIGEPAGCGWGDFPPCETNHANADEDPTAPGS